MEKQNLKNFVEKKNFVFLLLSLLIIVVLIIFLVLKKQKDSKNAKIIPPENLKDVIVIYKAIYKLEDIVPVECKSVLPVAYTKVISLSKLPVEEKKKKFIDIVLPSILVANFRIEQKRKEILKIKSKIEEGKEISLSEAKFLDKLLEQYKAESIDQLLIRLNTHPVSLILAQAAIESGWGESKFFVKGNNVFGMWTWDKKRKEKIRASKNKNVYLKKYRNILESVEDYLYSLNVSWAYKNFRLARLRYDNSLLLSNYLEKYSTLRKRYVERIKTIIKSNNLQKYDYCKINPDFIY